MKNKQKGFVKIILVLLLLVIIGGFVYWTSVKKSQSPAIVQETSTNRPGWITETNQQLNISFARPADATVSPVEQRKTTDGTTINEVIVIPTGTDPTRVHFFSTNTSIDKAKGIQIYGFSDIKNSEFSNISIGGYSGIKRIDHYSNNDCANELTAVNKNGTVYGYHIIQCPTHSEGYDQIRKDIANSLKFL